LAGRAGKVEDKGPDMAVTGALFLTFCHDVRTGRGKGYNYGERSAGHYVLQRNAVCANCFVFLQE
jgi:hypothetical protein